MVDYGLKDKVVIITGANNPQGIGAATALAFAREGAKVVLVYKKVFRPFDPNKTEQNGVDRYYAANAGNAEIVEGKLREMHADYLILESDISSEAAVAAILVFRMSSSLGSGQVMSSAAPAALRLTCSRV